MIVYKIVNSRNGRTYIGISTVGLRRRWTCHVFDANNGNPLPLYRDMRKCGVDAFTIATLYEATSIDELLTVERGLICAHGTHVKSGGYNCTLGGDGAEHLLRRGEDQYRALLTNDIVEFIRDPAKAHIVNREMVEMVEAEFGVAAKRDTVRDARRGDSWAHLNGIYAPIRVGQGKRWTERRQASSRRNIAGIWHKGVAASAAQSRGKPRPEAAKLTQAQAKMVFIDQRPGREIARELGIDHGTVSHIRRRLTWREATEGLIAPKFRRRNKPYCAKLTDEQARAIHDDKRPRKEIAAEHGVTTQSIDAIQNERYFKYLWGA
jgi:hypothetical protein